MEDNRIGELFAKTLEGAKGVVDANTVMGEPIVTVQGTTIIPISKVSVGFAGGGTDFSSKKDASGKKNFGGGGGTGITTKPVGFLTVDPSGSVKFINVENPTGGDMTLAELGEKLPALVAKIKEIINRKKEEKAAKKADSDEKPE